MADRTYPRMSYHTEWPKIAGQVIQDVSHDMRMGEGWDDPYGVRSAVVSDVEEPQPVERKKPGRKPKVQA